MSKPAVSPVKARFKGRDFVVLDAPACILEGINCPVCHELFSEPVTTSCGHFFCDDCVINSSSCPTCGTHAFSTSPGIGMTSKLIKSLQVKCPNSTEGCEWQGQLSDAQEHLGRSCVVKQTRCPYGCGEKTVGEFELEAGDHAIDDCPNRPCRCPHCGQSGVHKKVNGKTHYTLCQSFPLLCPAKCSNVTLIPRKGMKAHLAKKCEEEYVTCKYAMLGCNEMLKKRDVNAHLVDVRSHIKRCKQSISKELATAFGQFGELHCIPGPDIFNLLPLRFFPWLQNKPTCYPLSPWVVKLEGFDEARRSGGKLVSEPVNSHFGGYAMCLHVYPDGYGEGKGTHVSVYGHLMKNDSLLLRFDSIELGF